MTASGTFRQHLDDAGIEYGRLGNYTTRVTHDGMSFTVSDCYDGMLTAEVARLSPHEMASLVTRGRRRAAKRHIYYGDGVGHSECTACGRLVGISHVYCPWCGIEFNETEMISQ
jgi:hypothetical protein